MLSVISFEMDFDMFEGPTMVKIWKDPSKLTTTTTKKDNYRRKNGHDQALDVRQKAV